MYGIFLECSLGVLYYSLRFLFVCQYLLAAVLHFSLLLRERTQTVIVLFHTYWVLFKQVLQVVSFVCPDPIY